MRIAMIVAAAQNGVIGKDNQMPWHLPEDLKYFKRVTMTKPVVMGRKTYESIGRPLPGRQNIVVTRQQGWRPEDDSGREQVLVCADLDAALVAAKESAQASEVDEVMVIGGAQIYAACSDLADRLYLTEVKAEPQGDAYFSQDTTRGWVEVERQEHLACEKNPYNYAFVVLDRV